MRSLVKNAIKTATILDRIHALSNTCDCQRCLECFILHADNWVRQHFIYEGEDIETLRTPEYIDKHIKENDFFYGDCDDVATYLASIYYAAGLNVRFVAIRTHKEKPDYLHVYLEVYNPGKEEWIVIDPTVEPGTEIRSFSQMVLNV